MLSIIRAKYLYLAELLINETAKNASLRETKEEIGIDSSSLKSLGQLSSLYTPVSYFNFMCGLFCYIMSGYCCHNPSRYMFWHGLWHIFCGLALYYPVTNI